MSRLDRYWASLEGRGPGDERSRLGRSSANGVRATVPPRTHPAGSFAETEDWLRAHFRRTLGRLLAALALVLAALAALALIALAFGP